MEKKMVGEVYTLTGIDSTSQIRAFYKEVVEGNYEKYVAISVQNIKFKFNNETDKAEMLKPNEEFALNPMYRKVEVTPIDELVSEHIETAEITEVSDVQEVSNDKETENTSNETIDEEIVHTDDVTDKTVILEQKYKDLEILYKESQKNSAFEKEKAENAEQQLAYAKQAIEQRNETIKKLETELADITVQKEDLNKQYEQLLEVREGNKNEFTEDDCEPVTIDTIIESAKSLGYEIFFKKI